MIAVDEQSVEFIDPRVSGFLRITHDKLDIVSNRMLIQELFQANVILRRDVHRIDRHRRVSTAHEKYTSAMKPSSFDDSLLCAARNHEKVFGLPRLQPDKFGRKSAGWRQKERSFVPAEV